VEDILGGFAASPLDHGKSSSCQLVIEKKVETTKLLGVTSFVAEV
jgi:hypothetical protein